MSPPILAICFTSDEAIMRVLYVSHCGVLGGAERSLLELMVAVRQIGVEPILTCPGGPLAREVAAAGTN